MRRNIILFLIISFFIFDGCTLAIKNERKTAAFQFPVAVSLQDRDNDKINDFADILQSARSQIGVVTEYDTSYYTNAFPPPDRGACADVIWRALQGSGYDFKTLIDHDIKKFPQDYKEDPVPDPNINFRRVENIRTFLEKYARKLTTKAVPFDQENLKEWQAGDIITYAQIPGGLWHIAIISDQRRPDGVPLLIHNYGRGVREDDYLLRWPTKITGHYRWENIKQL